jgi:glycolate oxidase
LPQFAYLLFHFRSLRVAECFGDVECRLRAALTLIGHSLWPKLGSPVISAEREMRPYECDGLTAYRQLPMVVVLPRTVDEVSRVLRYCHSNGIKVVPRGAGTSLSGGALPLGDGVLLGMARFNRIREVDFANRVAVVEPGVTNLAITQAVAHRGFYYAPDPSSQIACTIGGNVAENSGGVHCLK